MVWKAADNAGLNPNPPYCFFFFKSFPYSFFPTLFLVSPSFLPSFSRCSLPLMGPYSKKPNQKKNLTFSKRFGSARMERSCSLQGCLQSDAPSACPSLPGWFHLSTKDSALSVPVGNKASGDKYCKI